jgi:pimeloyl-ACP methyl ester carboxylesterase
MQTIQEAKLKKRQITPDLDQVIQQYNRSVPPFYEEGETEIIYVPVDGGEIKVFHHKPDKITGKRPIVFVPGFATTPYCWRQVHFTHHYNCEYFHIETREKKSNRIRRHRKANFAVDQFSKDICDVINYVGLDKKDYVFMATCFGGGVTLNGIINGLLDPPTTVLFDPFTKWTQYPWLVKIVMPIIPPFLLGAIKYIAAKIIMARMKNKAQKERNMATIDSAIPWIWRKFSIQNVNFDLTDKLGSITKEIYIFHGPKDKFHPEGTFEKVTAKIPNGRFFHMKTTDENRELLAGVIATSFANCSADDGVPKLLQRYERLPDK